MKQIRKNVFETNSSSCHSLVISKDDYGPKHIPAYLNFNADKDYGWERSRYSSTEDKVSYLYTAMLDCDLSAQAKEFRRKLEEDFKIKIFVPDYKRETSKYSDWEFWNNGGSVDHAEELVPFINEILEDDDKLKRFLFDPRSCIYTGNDNGCDVDDDCCVAYVDENGEYYDWDIEKNVKHPLWDGEHYEYYFKGN